jgi:hypothetical protein
MISQWCEKLPAMLEMQCGVTMTYNNDHGSLYCQYAAQKACQIDKPSVHC